MCGRSCLFPIEVAATTLEQPGNEQPGNWGDLCLATIASFEQNDVIYVRPG